MRVKYSSDIAVITDIFRKIFTGSEKFNYGGKGKDPQPMKVVNTPTYDFDNYTVSGIDGNLVHWQKHPVIAICLAINPMDESVKSTYNVKDSINLQDASSMIFRDNF